jgi:hypothetical protein
VNCTGIYPRDWPCRRIPLQVEASVQDRDFLDSVLDAFSLDFPSQLYFSLRPDAKLRSRWTERRFPGCFVRSEVAHQLPLAVRAQTVKLESVRFHLVCRTFVFFHGDAGITRERSLALDIRGQCAPMEFYANDDDFFRFRTPPAITNAIPASVSVIVAGSGTPDCGLTMKFAE